MYYFLFCMITGPQIGAHLVSNNQAVDEGRGGALSVCKETPAFLAPTGSNGYPGTESAFGG
jgi:hypothetical protein